MAAELDERVRADLLAAEENGYNMLDDSSLDDAGIADDMIACTGGYEDVSRDDLIAAIARARRANAGGPTQHGRLLGVMLADIAEQGYRIDPTIPQTCATCAFRRGTLPNQTAATLLEALKIVMRTDNSPFGCHHGMNDGTPAKLCAGYVAAMGVPFDEVQPRLTAFLSDLERIKDNPDTVKANYDAWVRRVDPDHRMDAYQRARLFARQQPGAVEV